MRRGLAFIGVAVVVLGLAPARAGADGLPVDGVDAGRSGVALAGGAVRYVTLGAGRDTVVARVARDGGEVLRSRVLPGRLTIPAVALDATASGLSANGRTLVLIRPRRQFPQARTRFALLAARRLAVRERITLKGDFSFDALSPDGATMYLIRYTSRRDPTHYQVRTYDLRRGRMLPEPIVDPREPDERMRGFPITRTASRDGRWAYTLYDGAGEHPFIHALDTTRGEAACIDLDALTGRRDLYNLKLALDGPTLSVEGPRGQVARVDRATFRVSGPAPPAKPPVRAAGGGGGGETPWELLASGAAVLLLAAGAALALRREGAALR